MQMPCTMSISFRPIQEGSRDFLLSLLEAAFPPEERRTRQDTLRVLDESNNFHPQAIYSDEKRIGILTYWSFPDFYFIEHLAILPELRGCGYGKEALHQFKQLTAGLPIILEVEPPENRIAKRRIAFYQSCGYHLSDEFYEQPPYTKEGTPIPLRIMSSPDPIAHEFFLAFCKSTRATVYKTV